MLFLISFFKSCFLHSRGYGGKDGGGPDRSCAPWRPCPGPGGLDLKNL